MEEPLTQVFPVVRGYFCIVSERGLEPVWLIAGTGRSLGKSLNFAAPPDVSWGTRGVAVRDRASSRVCADTLLTAIDVDATGQGYCAYVQAEP